MNGSLLTIKDVMTRLNISRATIYRLIDQGELHPLKIGKALRFEQQDIEGFLQKRRDLSRPMDSPPD